MEIGVLVGRINWRWVDDDGVVGRVRERIRQPYFKEITAYIKNNNWTFCNFLPEFFI